MSPRPTQPPPPGPVRSPAFPPVQRRSLPVGLPLLAVPARRHPVVTVAAVLEAGALRDPPHRAGLADWTFELLRSGTERRDADGLAEALEGLGVHLTTETTWDATVVSFTALREVLPQALALWAELLRQPSFPDDEVERTRRERLAALRQRRTDPRALANEAFARTLFASTSPFARAVDGLPETIARIQRSDIVAFHAAHARPAGAAIVAAGDVDADEFVDRVTPWLEGWVGAPPAPPAIDLTTNPAPRVVVVHRPGSVQSELRVGHLGTARGDPAYAAVLVLNTLLGGAFGSRLNLNLRERRGYTYGAHSAFALRRHPGPFVVATAVQTEVTGAALGEILHELRAVVEGPILPTEVDDARTYLAGTFALPLETTAGLASRLVELHVHRLPDDSVPRFLEELARVDVDAVQAAVRRLLHPDRVVVTIVGDAERVAPQLEGLGLPGPDVVDPDTFLAEPSHG